MMPVSLHSLHSLRGDEGRSVAEQLRPWLDHGLLLGGEIALAARIASLDGRPTFEHVLAFALTLAADRRGSALVDLSAVDVDALLDEREHPADGPSTPPPAPAPPWETWRSALQARPALVWTPGPDDTARTAAPAPFVLVDQHLYTARGWAAESRIAHGVRRLTDASAPKPSRKDRTDSWTAIESSVLSLITGGGAEQQHAAARSAVGDHRLQIVIGGPGTGKTFTVRAMLTLLWLDRAVHHGHIPSLDIRLAAPTGKAAQRMKEAMALGLDEWSANVADQLCTHESLRAALPTDLQNKAELVDHLTRFLAGLTAQTLHRLLGYQHFNPTRFKHNALKPLSADVVIVDEASMVDLAMMAHLFDAIGSTSRLVLVGDRRQLASVDTGTVLADLCAWGRSDERPLVALTTSRRFAPTSAVGRFAAESEAIETHADPAAAARGVATRLAEAADSGPSASNDVRVRWVDREATADARYGTLPKGLEDELDAVAAYWTRVTRVLHRCVFDLSDEGTLSLRDEAALHSLAALVDADDPPTSLPIATLLTRLSEKVRMLAAHRSGTRGVAGLNRAVWTRIQSNTRALPAAERPTGLLGRALQSPAVGKPILVTKNDYGLGRYNGDIGLWVYVRPTATPEAPPTLLAVFADQADRVAAHSAARLPEHEVVWAMTVHKSQGSEFDRVVFVLPHRSTSLWTRELVYTGITRVKKELVLVGTQGVLAAGMARTIRRASGLQDRLG